MLVIFFLNGLFCTIFFKKKNSKTSKCQQKRKKYEKWVQSISYIIKNETIQFAHPLIHTQSHILSHISRQSILFDRPLPLSTRPSPHQIKYVFQTKVKERNFFLSQNKNYSLIDYINFNVCNYSVVATAEIQSNRTCVCVCVLRMKRNQFTKCNFLLFSP